MFYTFDTPPMPVLLDSVSIKHNVVLLLNTFFYILIYSYILYLRHSSYTSPSRQCIHQAQRCPPPQHVFPHSHPLLCFIPSILLLCRSFSTVYPSSTTLSSSSTRFSTFSSSAENLSLNGGIKDIKIKQDTRTLRNYLKSPLPMLKIFLWTDSLYQDTSFATKAKVRFNSCFSLSKLNPSTALCRLLCTDRHRELFSPMMLVCRFSWDI